MKKLGTRQWLCASDCSNERLDQQTKLMKKRLIPDRVDRRKKGSIPARKSGGQQEKALREMNNEGLSKSSVKRWSTSGSGVSASAVGKLRTIAQTAEILQTSKRTVQRLIKSRKLRAHHINRLVRISDAAIAVLLENTWSD